MKSMPPPPQLTVVWYQAPVNVTCSPEKLPYYKAIMNKIMDRVDVFPQLQLDWVFCEVTDTVNLAGETTLFAGFEQDLLNAGFRPMSIPNEGMDAQERLAFRQALLSGGTLH